MSGGFKWHRWFSHGSGGFKSKTWVLVGVSSGESPLPHLCISFLCAHGKRERPRATVLTLCGDSTFMTSPHPDHLLKAPSPNTIPLKVRPSTDWFWEDTNVQSLGFLASVNKHRPVSAHWRDRKGWWLQGASKRASPLQAFLPSEAGSHRSAAPLLFSPALALQEPAKHLRRGRVPHYHGGF